MGTFAEEGKMDRKGKVEAKRMGRRKEEKAIRFKNLRANWRGVGGKGK